MTKLIIVCTPDQLGNAQYRVFRHLGDSSSGLAVKAGKEYQVKIVCHTDDLKDLELTKDSYLFMYCVSQKIISAPMTRLMFKLVEQYNLAGIEDPSIELVM